MSQPTPSGTEPGADYRDLNRASWDERAPAHLVSPDYDVQRFLDDPGFVSGVVEFDRPLLGDVRGLRGVHLQCHIGTDTVSLARLGARMSGLDFSGPAIEAARDLAVRTGADVEYVRADLYDALDVLPRGGFDLVYTGIGALCWLPSVQRWADVVAGLLAPGGRLFVREGHPMLWAMADPEPGTGPDGAVSLGFAYFEQEQGLVWTDGGTYVQTDVEFSHNTTVSWNHGLGEIVSALLERGLRVTGLVEHDSVPWEALPGLMRRDDHGEWRLTHGPERLAASYTLQAVRERA
jgi:SAM-dependent methyltransferase